MSGKYSSNSFPDDNSRVNGNQGVSVSTIDANKKLDEITPLLNQARISSSNSNSVEHDDEPNTNPTSNNSNRGGNHKSSYRKRVKTKLSRKTA